MSGVAPIGGLGQAGISAATYAPSIEPGSGSIGPDASQANGAAAFNQAVETRSTDVAAASISQPDRAAHQIAMEVRDLSDKISTWHKPEAAVSTAIVSPDTQNGGHAGLTGAMQEAVSGMQGAYVFAIEATLASRGSTEGTKIINTLLKGQ